MYVVSVWALIIILKDRLKGADLFVDPVGWALAFVKDPVAWVAALLVGLSVLMLIEGIRALIDRNLPADSPPPKPVDSPALQGTA
jgi:hypothetical protein